MASSIDPSLPPGRATRPARPARADEAEPDAANDSDAEFVIVSYELQRQEASSVEHTRQSRLQRWQRLP